MRASTILGGLALVATASSSSLPRDVADDLVLSPELADLIESAKTQVIQEVTDNEEKLRKRGETPSCTIGNLVFRREYGSLSKTERLAYVNAVKCLQSLPPRTPASVAPGAKSRFDDFTVTHIQQTLSIHYSGIFQPWHRWFVYQYEKALRDECGYMGYQPYWDWPKYAAAPQDSPIFNGDAYSLGGNGEYIPHNGPVIEPPAGIGGGMIQLPAGVGGGYVTTGPFVNMTVNLGPVGGTADTLPGPLGGLGWNPRKMKRDLGGAMNTRYANYTTVLNMLSTPNIDKFRLVSEGVPYTVEIGPHGGIHYTMGGDPGGDLFTSPSDPAFWVHHGQMDRVWSIWQALGGFSTKRYTDLGSGNYAHITWANEPASDYTKLSDVIDMGYAAESTTIANVMSTTSGDFCYFYL
ncbi:tyrosinase-like protein [Cercophora scortea]|uniref:Tyrosinase-like protein n=1 Tax=Cercophora scortea TaxID=314031 RepID=A0AAE0M4V7_9PEZI|nr:tyrosinase-like protein [Cercophora scortea]